MDVSNIETSGLGDRSYLVDHGGIAVVIDPQRDIGSSTYATAPPSRPVTSAGP